MLLGLALLLFLLVQVLAVIHDAAYGRLGCRRNLYQIQILTAGHPDRLERRHYSNLFTFITDHAYFASSNTIINSDKTFVDTFLPWRSKRLRIRDYNM